MIVKLSTSDQTVSSHVGTIYALLMFVTMSPRRREGKTKMKKSQVFMKWFEEQLLPF